MGFHFLKENFKKLSFEVITLKQSPGAEETGFFFRFFLQHHHPGMLSVVLPASAAQRPLCIPTPWRLAQTLLESRDYTSAVGERPGLCLKDEYFLIYSESKAKLLKHQKELIDMPCNVRINFIFFCS